MTVQLDALTIRYGKHTAVDAATAVFPAGAVGLLGRNGAGKTSILKSMLGLVKPVSGRIQILDLPADIPAADLRQRVGYMPEKECHISGLNGYETVLLAGQLTGLPGLEASRRAHEVLYLVGLGEQRYRPVSGYSTGMKQKVKLAAALVHDPDVLFLDEPTNGLDPDGRRDMLALVRSLSTELGKSIVLSSHILQDVEATCTHIVLMELGKVLASGPIAELTRSPERIFDLELGGAETGLEQAFRDLGVTELERRGQGWRLTVPEGLSVQALFAAVREGGSVVRRLEEHRRTLEEVFLGTVDRASEHSSEHSSENSGGLS